MKNKVILVFILTITAFSARGQSPLQDSLKQELLKSSAHDTTKCFILSRLLGNADDLDEWKKYNDQIMAIALLHKDDTNKAVKNEMISYYADCQNNLGYFNSYLGDFNKAMQYSKFAFQIKKYSGSIDGMGTIANNIGFLYSRVGDISEGIKYYLIAQNYFIKEKDIDGLALSFNNIGAVYGKQGLYENSLEYFKKAEFCYRYVNDTVGIAMALSNIADVYTYPDFMNCALEDTACKLTYLKKSLQVYLDIYHLVEHNKNSVEYGDITNSLAYFYIENYQILPTVNGTVDPMKNLEICKKYLDMGYDVRLGLERFDAILQSEITYCKYYNAKGDYQSAIKFGEEALASALAEDQTEMIRDVAKYLSYSYSQIKNYAKAYEMNQIYTENQDKLNNEVLKNDIIKKTFQIEYERKSILDSTNVAEQKRIMNDNLEKEKSEKKRLIYIFLSCLAVIAVLGALIYYINKINISRKAAYKRLYEKNIQIEEQQGKLIELNSQISKYQSQMNPHFVFNALNSIQGFVIDNAKDKSLYQIQLFSKLMRQTLNNSSSGSISIKSELEFLKNYFDFEKDRFKTNIHLEFEHDFEPEEYLIPPMMIQPFVENSLKYAGFGNLENGTITVKFETVNDLLSITITDNGLGITKPINEIEQYSHAISIVKSRIKLLFEKEKKPLPEQFIWISSRPEYNGTKILFVIPLIGEF